MARFVFKLLYYQIIFWITNLHYLTFKVDFLEIRFIINFKIIVVPFDFIIVDIIDSYILNGPLIFTIIVHNGLFIV